MDDGLLLNKDRSVHCSFYPHQCIRWSLLRGGDGHSRILINPDFTPRVPNLESIHVVVIFESVDETLVCDHSNKRY